MIRPSMLILSLAAACVLTGCSGHHGSKSSANGGSSGSVVSPAPSSVSSGASSSGGTKPGAASKPATTSSATGVPTEKPGSSGTSSAGLEVTGGSGTESCKLTSARSVVAAFGGAVGSEKAGFTGTGSKICQFGVTASNLGVTARVTVTVHTPTSLAAFRQGKSSAVRQGATSVAGVGDDGYYNPSSATVQFIKGSAGIAVQAAPAAAAGRLISAEQLRADLVALARSVAAQL